MYMEKFLVKKWWWENAAELYKSPENVVKDFSKWVKQAVVVSAIRSPDFNTTDKLIELWEALWERRINTKIVNRLIDELKVFHINMISEKLSWNIESVIDQVALLFEFFRNKIIFYISNRLETPNKDNDYIINTAHDNLSIIWFWEDLSAEIQKIVINNLNLDWLEAEVVDFQVMGFKPLLVSRERLSGLLFYRLGKKPRCF